MKNAWKLTAATGIARIRQQEDNITKNVLLFGAVGVDIITDRQRAAKTFKNRHTPPFMKADPVHGSYTGSNTERKLLTTNV